MAITKNYTTDQGVNCPNAYIVVSNVNYTKFPVNLPNMQTGLNSFANVSIYFSQTTREANQKPLTTFTIQFETNPSNSIFEQAYTALKELPEMAGAVDC